jgi:hypothetical protein
VHDGKPVGLKRVLHAMEIKTEWKDHLADSHVQAETGVRGKMNCERRGQRAQTKMRSKDASVATRGISRQAMAASGSTRSATPA